MTSLDTTAPRTKAHIKGAPARRQAMLDYLIQAGSAQVDELAERFGVSRMTVHRDLDSLSEQGMVNKQHGGVTTRSSSVFESNFALRSHIAAREKQALARAALEEIAPGQAVMLDDSTTASELASLLPTREPLTVITNGLESIGRLKAASGIKLITLGGDYQPRFNATFGLLCEQTLANLRASVAVLSASAILGTTAYVQDPAVTQIKRAQMAAAERRILLIHSAKFGHSALHRLADLSEFDLVLIDAGLSAEHRAALDEAEIVYRLIKA
ncbi:DeoR/GlpR family DNA-binding transcription regulator [Chromohalobacter canadensis]|uniref:DeoR/GlpR family DNA-binding transcription regulator n=1 Tax=Chromohalobacter canadensis TaxID=141389 RepID=A0ABZ0YDX0_9GAMM|nr:DeoR/GlpR family DNA-binding transcription regulator [Chromohalobacter canadensis]MCK0770185.1 DeoR/GlpR family DNA-binding transcription regulator [Chromohalobacter canadensis]WQH10287.1 DeoR/GlpR family DNA-binding transcription regulator [Chromohalobacter canadensis]